MRVRCRPVCCPSRSSNASAPTVPLLPPLGLGLARWISTHYLAPPALVLRAMLPPGMLERLELLAERAPGDVDLEGLGPVERDLLEQLAAGPKPARSLAAPEGRAGLVRRLRALADRGAISLDWTLLAASGGPRYERWVELTPEGREAAATLAGEGRLPGRPLGPRQVAVLTELAGPAEAGASVQAMRGADLAAHHGSAAIAGLVRRGLVASEIRERPRRPLAGRPVGRRGGRPATSDLTPPQVEAVDAIRAAMSAGDPTPLLLDGVTGGGKTAIYVDAIATALDVGRRVLMLVPEISLALPLVDRLRADLDARIALVHSGLGDGERADEWRRIRGGEADIVVGTRLAVLAPLPDVGLVIVDEEHEAAYKSDRTPRLQARDVAIELAEPGGRGDRPRVAPRRPSTAWASPAPGGIAGSCCPVGPSASCRR